ncbi:MAG: pilus assembly FimT family protein [Fimbriiglobus sp.]
MPRRRRCRRPGYTLIELLAVMAALIILGAVLLPTLSGLTRDTNVKAAGDLMRERVADARANAIGAGKPYRLAVSADGGRVRVGPDDESFTDPVSADDETPFMADDALPGAVTATPMADGDAPMTDDGGWVRVATFLPDGTCREDGAELELREPDVFPLRFVIRGLTGSASVAPAAGGAP